MAVHVYHTDEEHNQTMLDLCARMIFDRSSYLLSNDTPVYKQVDALSVLSDTAINSGLSNTVINHYYNILDAENSKNEDQTGWYK